MTIKNINSEFRLLFELPELDNVNTPSGKQGIRCYTNRITGFFLWFFRFAVYSSEEKIYINKSSFREWMKSHQDCELLKKQSFSIDKEGVDSLVNRCKQTLINRLKEELKDLNFRLKRLKSGETTPEEDIALLKTLKNKKELLLERSSPEIQDIKNQIKSTLDGIKETIKNIAIRDISAYQRTIDSSIEILKNTLTEKDIFNIKKDAEKLGSQKNQITDLVNQLKNVGIEIDKDKYESLEEKELEFKNALSDADIVLEQISNNSQITKKIPPSNPYDELEEQIINYYHANSDISSPEPLLVLQKYIDIFGRIEIEGKSFINIDEKPTFNKKGEFQFKLKKQGKFWCSPIKTQLPKGFIVLFGSDSDLEIKGQLDKEGKKLVFEKGLDLYFEYGFSAHAKINSIAYDDKSENFLIEAKTTDLLLNLSQTLMVSREKFFQNLNIESGKLVDGDYKTYHKNVKPGS